MSVSDLDDPTRLAWHRAGAMLTDMMTPTLRLGVTGLSRAGKTIFITALIRNLVSGGRLPFFMPEAEGRIEVLMKDARGEALKDAAGRPRTRPLTPGGDEGEG